MSTESETEETPKKLDWHEQLSMAATMVRDAKRTVDVIANRLESVGLTRPAEQLSETADILNYAQALIDGQHTKDRRGLPPGC